MKKNIRERNRLFIKQQRLNFASRASTKEFLKKEKREEERRVLNTYAVVFLDFTEDAIVDVGGYT